MYTYNIFIIIKIDI